MKSAIVFAGMLTLAASPASARETVYQNDGYTVYREEPGYCAMFLDTSQGSMMRFSYRASNRVVFFSWVSNARLPSNPPFLINILWDQRGNPLGIQTQPYALDDGRSGFSLETDATFLSAWARHGEAQIRILSGRPGMSPYTVEIVPLRGSGAAVGALLSCAAGGRQARLTRPVRSVSIAPAPPAPGMDAPDPSQAEYEEAEAMRGSGRFRVDCTRGREVVLVDGRTIRSGGPFECETGQEPMTTLVRSRTFPNGDQILLVKDQPSGVANSGSVIRIRPGAAPVVIPIEYMTEFGALRAVDRVEIVAGGVQDINCGTTYWTTEVRIDWARGTTRVRELSRDRGCGNR